MPQHVILSTHTQLSEEAKKLIVDRGARAVYVTPPFSEDQLIEAITRDKVAGVLMRMSPPFTRRVIEASPTMKIIVKHGAGVDSVDLDAATERGVIAATTGDANADPVAEWAIAAMMSLARDIPRLDREIRAGGWVKGAYAGHEFRGRTLGVIGYGAIGRRVAEMARALGVNVLVYSRARKASEEGVRWETDFDRLLSTVDILSLHCPLTDETRGLIGRRELELMKPTAILVNTARGPIVDEAALTEALTNGRIKAAALDVFAQEPTSKDNPLLKLPNVLVSPHVSAMTEEAMTRMGISTVNQILDYLEKKIVVRENVANRAVLEKL
jgi:D-3-phosphoglycerate dehydrogenase / 2-oxoglutarate reductase